MLKKIVVIGPESAGKTSLCEQLAARYHASWCPEYAREFLSEHGMRYTYDDLLTIARGQLALEERYIAAAEANKESLLFIDTDMYVMKVWCEVVYGRCHRFILDQVVQRKYDAYLLCKPDLPWVEDGLREYPGLEARQRLYRIYLDCMVNQPVPWTEISGSYEERLQTALAAISCLQQ